MTPRPGTRTTGRLTASATDSQLTPTTVGPRLHAPADDEAEEASQLSVQFDVDFEAREARIAFMDGADPLRFVFKDGSWRPVS